MVGTSGVTYILHNDWLGSARLTTAYNTRSMYYDTAYAPYGESYSSTSTSTSNLDFTGEFQDTMNGLYDFLYREYDPVQGRWISPDPAGATAVDPMNPQSWNRYAYVSNAPVIGMDSNGLCPNFQLECPDSGNASGGIDEFDMISINAGWKMTFEQSYESYVNWVEKAQGDQYTDGKYTYSLNWSVDGGAVWTIPATGVAVSNAAMAEILGLDSSDSSGGAATNNNTQISLRVFGQPANCSSHSVGANFAYMQFENVPSYPNGIQVTNVDVKTKGGVVSSLAGANLVFGSLQNPFPNTPNPPASGITTWAYGYSGGPGSLQWKAKYKINGHKQPALKKTFEVTCQSK